MKKRTGLLLNGLMVILWLMAAVPVFTACKTTHHTARVESYENKTVQVEISEEITETAQAETREVSSTSRDLAMSDNMTFTRIDWSPPDIFGHQFPTRTIQAERNKITQEREEQYAEREQKWQAERTALRQEIQQLKAEKVALLEEMTKVEPKPPLRAHWQRFRAWLGGIALMIALGLAAYKIIKHKPLKRK
jgi:hypothetical protein